MASLVNVKRSDLNARRWNWIYQVFRKVMHNFFKLACLFSTIVVVIWCCFEFSKDEDVCEVLFKKFHEDEHSIYPDITFGLPNRVDETTLRTYDNSYNEMNYRRFLNNRYWDQKMLDIDFENVSMRLKDHLIQTCLYDTLLDKMNGICKEGLIIKRRDDFGYAYFTLHFPSDIPIYSASIKLKSSIFENGIRPATDEFYVFFHYPDQRYLSFSTYLYQWPLRTTESTKNYIMRFNLRSMEVLQRRQKRHTSCYSRADYDGQIRKSIIEKAGCRPSMWTAKLSGPFCTTSKSLQEIGAEHLDQLQQRSSNKTYLQPCRLLKKAQIDYVEVDYIEHTEKGLFVDDEGWFILEFDVRTNGFKEIKQVRKYNIQSLVGNAGGYIGLFLGFAIWNVPTLIVDTWKYIKAM